MQPLLSSWFPAVVLAVAVMAPSVSFAQFKADKPKDVGTVFMPFTAEDEADDSLAFLLEDLVGAKLLRRVKRPIYVGRDVTIALTGTPDSCLKQPECVQLLGGQFNASLVADTKVARAGSDVEIKVAWYTTGNGLKAHKEAFSFPVGEEDLMLDELARIIEQLFEASLKIRPETLAQEGGIIGGPDDTERLAELERGRKKSVSSRREDFGTASSNADLEGDTPGDLRAVAAAAGSDDEDPPPRAERTKPRKKTSSSSSSMDTDVSDLEEEDGPVASAPPPEDEDLDLDDDDPVVDRSDEPEEISLSANETRGDSVANYMEAQRLGIGKREYNRMARSGLPFAEYQARRWAYGKRFHLKVGAFYGFGGLTRRYATTIFVRAGNAKSEEASWESLGASWVNPGGQIGFGFAPVDELEIAFDVGVMYARQDLRREYDSSTTGSNIPATPDSAPTAHVVADLKARFFILPRRKVKIAPHIGATMLVMAGYDIVPDPPLVYSSRPPAVVIGVTAGAGVSVMLSPFVGLDIDLSGTVYVSQGAASFEGYEFFDGVTEPYLEPEKLGARLPAIPAFGRLTVGPRFLF
jgi:hypothetical protein